MLSSVQCLVQCILFLRCDDDYPLVDRYYLIILYAFHLYLYTNMIIKVDEIGTETTVSCFSLREGVLQRLFLHDSTACLFLFNRVQNESRKTCCQLSWSFTATNSLAIATPICREFCCLGYSQAKDITMHHP